MVPKDGSKLAERIFSPKTRAVSLVPWAAWTMPLDSGSPLAAGQIREGPPGARTVLAEDLSGLQHGPQLGLELTAEPARSSQHSGLRRADAGDLAAIDPILLDPLRECDGMDVEFGGGLVLRLAGSNLRDGPSAELGRAGTRPRCSALPVKAVT
jgi:hypothetical protein